MPMVIPAVAASALGAAIAGTAISTAILGALASSVLSFVASSIFSPSKPKAQSVAQSLSDRTLMVRQPITERKIVYGRSRVSGPIVFIETTGNDRYLHLVIALAGHEIDAVEAVYFDDVKVWDSSTGYANITLANGTTTSWNSVATVTAHLGTATQTANTQLDAASTKWTSDHRLQGVAYLYCLLTYSGDAANNPYQSGIPSVSAIIRGKKVYDPRSATTAWSNNPALAIRDYLTDDDLGLGCSSSEIDDDLIEAAANICDEDVTLRSGTEDRYDINGVVDTAEKPSDILKKMLTSCAGKLIYSGGVFKLFAGAYVSPTISLDEDDLRGPLSIQTKRSRRDNYNAVKGVFSSSAHNYTATDYPAIISSAYAIDDGETIYKDLELPFTVSSPMAQRIAKIFLLQSRQQIVVSAPCKLTALRVKAGDTVQFSNERMGWTNKVFEVESLNFATDENGAVGVDLVLRETDSAIYSWTSTEEIDFLEDNETNLPSAFTIVPPGLALSDTVRTVNETAVSVLIADVTSNNTYQQTFEVQARKTGDTEWINLGRAAGNRFELLNVEDAAEYEVRAAVVNSIGIRSSYTTSTRTIVGKTTNPSDVTGLGINIILPMLQLVWDAVSDGDLSHYRVRYSPLTSGAVWSNAIDIVPKVARPATSVTVPAQLGTYMVKAYDVLGLSSETAASVVSPVDALLGLVTNTSTQHSGFSGSKSQCTVVDDCLMLSTNVLIDDVADVDAIDDFDGLGGDYYSSGTYDFSTYIDFGEVVTRRLVSSITVERYDAASLIDSITTSIDDWPSFDGDANNWDDVSCQLFVKTTEDDPTGSPTWSAYKPFTVADFKARAAWPRLVLTTTNTRATPKVTALTTTASAI